ncbi:MAG TPA: metalloregulator ArsR/SmtB family transcription factor, partial [Planctomycetota bacterium]|nr:metalloregulator ArsR/SmtB family transcription factor [Planctomycetota bacterium]
ADANATPDRVARCYRALADATRLRLLTILAGEELNVQELVEILGITQSRVSRHLAYLKGCGFVADRREGTWSFYRLVGTGDARPEQRLAFALWHGMPATTRQMPDSDRRRLDGVLQSRRSRSLDFFQKSGSRWDEIRKGIVGQDALSQGLMALLPETLTVLDIGCGTGGFLTRIAPFVKNAIGVDIAPAMLKLAGERLAQAGLSNVRLVESDMQKLSLPDHAVDVVFLTLVLHHAPSPRAAIDEALRVCKPSGTVVVTDIVAHDQEWVREAMGDIWLGFEPQQVETWMRQAGLGRIQVHAEEGEYAPPQAPANGNGRKPLKLFVVSGRLEKP